VHPKAIFITGTDTGVGKTVLTTLLLAHLRQSGHPAFALKPFCSGDRADARVLHGLQDGDLTLDQVNAFHFREPLAPMVAARLHGQRIRMNDALRRIRQVSFVIQNQKSKIKNPLLLIEGAGGLLAPLGEGFNAADLIKKLRCDVIIAAANRLGALNHTALTAGCVSQCADIQRVAVVLVDVERPSRIKHHASRTNPEILSELLAPIPVFRLPHLPELAKTLGKTERKSLLITCAKKLKKTLAEILG
jgi:dethiobiotin synthetase